MEQLEAVSSEILKYAICPICSDFIGTSIFQCSAGHHICANCVRRESRCATCRLPYLKGGIRSLPLERLLQSCGKTIPCTQAGCEFTGEFDEMEEHERGCPERDVKCPLMDCTWVGKIKDAVGHVERSHTNELIDLPDGQIMVVLNNPEGERVDIHAEVPVRLPNGKIFLVAFSLLRGYDSSRYIVGFVQHVGVSMPSLKSHMTVNIQDHECQIMCMRNTWSLADSTHMIMTAQQNLRVDWDMALVSGRTKAIYDHHDHLQRTPYPESLNLPIHVLITEGEQTPSPDDKKAPSLELNLMKRTQYTNEPH